jgi:hypothetical protein
MVAGWQPAAAQPTRLTHAVRPNVAERWRYSSRCRPAGSQQARWSLLARRIGMFSAGRSAVVTLKAQS